jgi:hypothetical protein
VTGVYIYTQHKTTIEVIKEIVPNAAVLEQDRSVRAAEDVAKKAPPGSVVIGVMPMDDAAELGKRGYTVIMPSLDGKIVEKLTGKPYNPKEEYPADVVRQALKYRVVSVQSMEYIDVRQLFEKIAKAGGTAVIFNDDMRAALQSLAQEMGYSVSLVKSGQGYQINPLEFSGEAAFISFPGTAGRLTPDQMKEALKSGQARVYVVTGFAKTYTDLREALAASAAASVKI